MTLRTRLNRLEKAKKLVGIVLTFFQDGQLVEIDTSMSLEQLVLASFHLPRGAT